MHWTFYRVKEAEWNGCWRMNVAYRLKASCNLLAGHVIRHYHASIEDGR
jgi:hypothetical protein